MEVFVTVSEWPASGVILREGKVEKREKPQYSNDQDTPVTPSSAGGATEPPPTAVTTRPSPPAATDSRLRKYLLSRINYDQQLGPVPPSAGRRQSSPEPPARKTFGEDKVIWSPSHITIKHRTRPDQPPRSIVFPLCAFTHSRDLCSRTIDSRHQQHFSRLTTPTNTHRSRSSSQRPTFPQATRIPTSMGPNPDVAVQQILESRLTVASSQRTPRDTHITPRQHQFSRVCFGSRCSGGESGCALRLRSCDKLSYIFSLMSCSQTEVLAVEIIQKESISELVLKKFSQVRYHQLKPPRKNVYNLPLRIKVQISDLQSDTRDRQNYNLMLHVRREVVGFSQLVIKKQVSSVPPAVTGGQVSHIPPDNFKTQMTLIYSAETQNREFFLQKTELDVSYKLPARSNILNTRDGHTEDSGTPGSYNTHSSATTHHTSRGIRKSHWNPRQLPLFPIPRTPPARRPEPNHYEENRFKRSEVSSLDRDTTERFLLCGRSCHQSTVCNSGRESSAKRSEEEQQSREYGRLPRREIQLVALAQKSAREVTIMKDNWRIGAGPGIDLVKINTRKMETCDQRLCMNHQLATREKTSMVVNGCQQGTQEVEEDSQCEVTRWCRASPCHPGAIGRPALDRRQHGVVRQSGWVVWASWVLVMVAVWACVALTYAHPHQNTGGGCDDYITSPPNKSCYSLSLETTHRAWRSSARVYECWDILVLP
ncbi:uncharacterized protein LOC121858836 [Homarus americanus]|uniref:uncharacterized protein LOC121858836 n=1 Tax=Homarus americanus TaxID=6706 RepID=UPI001C468B72|nr:uncharacterized protein LOC121858836 [Homarus americanus]